MKNLELSICKGDKRSTETQWLGFKHNNVEPKMIGEDISEIANTASLYDRRLSYTSRQRGLENITWLIRKAKKNA